MLSTQFGERYIEGYQPPPSVFAIFQKLNLATM